MGLDTIPTRAGGKVLDEWFNVFKRVLIGDIVPRDSTGAPVDGAGSLGSTAYTWLNGFFSNLKFKSGANTVTLRASGGMTSSFELTMPAALPVSTSPILVDPSGTVSYAGVPTSGIADNAITYAKRSAMNYAQSAEIVGYSNSTTSLTSVVTQSITTSGKPVLIGLIPSNATNAGKVGFSCSTGGAAGCTFSIFRNGTNIGNFYFSFIDITGGSGIGSQTVPPFSVGTLDIGASSGSNSYELKAKVDAATHTVTVDYVKLTLMEWG